jgi:tRNA-dihydrouridine synthase
MSKVPAHWELMAQINQIRKDTSPETILVGNGDVISLKDGKEKVKKYGIDGMMIGR